MNLLEHRSNQALHHLGQLNKDVQETQRSLNGLERYGRQYNLICNNVYGIQNDTGPGFDFSNSAAKKIFLSVIDSMNPPMNENDKKLVLEALDLIHFLPSHNTIIVRFNKISTVRTLIEHNNRITKSFPQHNRKVLFLNNLTKGDAAINKKRAEILKTLYDKNKSIKAYKASGGKLGIIVRSGDSKQYYDPSDFDSLIDKYAQ